MSQFFTSGGQSIGVSANNYTPIKQETMEIFLEIYDLPKLNQEEI